MRILSVRFKVTTAFLALALFMGLLLLAPLARTVRATGPTGTWAGTGSMMVGSSVTIFFDHTATLLASGKVLAVGGYYTPYSATVYDPATGIWTSTGQHSARKSGHTATLLPNGKVLVAGGANDTGGFLASAQLYDPSTGGWADTGSMVTARVAHTATLLPNGKVLVAGGKIGAAPWATAAAELYDPSTGTWAVTGSMTNIRYSHTATLLPNGNVLVAGGYALFGTTILAAAELYDPSTGTWTPTGSMAVVRYDHTATLLANGKVLVTGGYNGATSGYPLYAAELYDPSTGSWAPTGSMITSRYVHTATLLSGGKVLVAGGYTGSPGVSGAVPLAELYDPNTGGWVATGSMTNRRYEHTATLLASGKVLVAGGRTGYADLATAELYDPGTVDATTTSVSCTPNPVLVNQPISCAATVHDSAATGATPPTGTVTFTSSGAGTFSPGTSCTLIAEPPASASCSLGYTPSAAGSPTITASYGGDTTHLASIGSTSVTIQDPPPTFSNVPAPGPTEATGPGGAVVAYTAPIATDPAGGTDPVTCTPPSGNTFPLGTTTVSCTATSRTNQSATVSFSLEVRDTIAPTANPTASAAGWSQVDVTVSWNWSDGGAGIDPANCTASSQSSGEGIQTPTATCTDLAGNTGTATYEVKVDKTKPVITPHATANGSPYTAGIWTKYDVVVSFDCTDGSGSGIATNTLSGATVSTEGTPGSVTNGGACVDAAGNAAAAVTFSPVWIDKTAPTANPTASAAGWSQVDVTVSWNWSDGSASGIDPANCTTTSISSGEGIQTLTASCNDRADNTGTASYEVKVDKTQPIITIASPLDLSVNSAGLVVTFSATDVPSGVDVDTVVAALSDGTTSTGILVESGHVVSAAGVYTLTVTATDRAGNTATQSRMFVVYDASAGYVSGGGWIDSPPGAYLSSPSLGGRATFGFVSQYKKGANVPTGNTQFRFRAAGLDLNSTSYDWLVVAGAKAQYKGVGTINGVAGFRFMLTAIDGDINGGGGVDRFRIRIWNPSGGLIYDNQMNAPEDADPTTAIAGGNIVIHQN